MKSIICKGIYSKTNDEYSASDNEYDIVNVTKIDENLNTTTIMQNKSETETNATLIMAQYKDGILKQINDKEVKLQKAKIKLTYRILK